MRGYTLLLCLLLITVALARPGDKKHHKQKSLKHSSSKLTAERRGDDFAEWRERHAAQQNQRKQIKHSRKVRETGQTNDQQTRDAVEDFEQWRARQQQQTQQQQHSRKSRSPDEESLGGPVYPSATNAEGSAIATNSAPSLGSAPVGTDHDHVTQPPSDTVWAQIAGGVRDAYEKTLDKAKELSQQVSEAVGK